MNQLRGQLRQARTDTARARLLVGMAIAVEGTDSGIVLLQQSFVPLKRALRTVPAANRAPMWLLYADANYGMAYLFDLQGQTDSVLRCYQRALLAYQHARSTFGIAETARAIALNYIKRKDHPNTLTAFRRGLRIIEALPESQDKRKGQALFLHTMGSYYAIQNDESTARQYLTKGLRIIGQDSVQNLQIVQMRSLLARVEAANPALLPQAEAHARQALQLAQHTHGTGVMQASGPVARGEAYFALGQVLRRRGQLAEARTALEHALQLAIAEDYLFPDFEVLVLIELALVESRSHHAEVAQRYLDRAQALMTAQHTSHSAFLYEAQAEVAHARGQDSTALRAYKQFVALRDSSTNEQSRRAALTQRLTTESQLKEARLVAARQIDQAEIRRQKQLRWAVVGGALFLLAVAAAFYRWQRARQQATRALEHQRLRDLEELDRLKTSFFLNISHEFRTPLTLILGPAETIAAAPATEASPAVRQAGELVRRNARKLLRLITQLLDLSKLEAGALRLIPTAGDAALATRQAVGSFASLADTNGVALITDVPAGPLPLVFDAAKLEEMLDNLLANALRLTPAGGRVLVTAAAVAASDGAPAGVAWTVTDTGPGIAPEHVSRLFERFYQVPGAGAAHAGTGLGLALARELATLHGGTITVSSTPGQGTTFRLTLPHGLSPVTSPTPPRSAAAPPALDAAAAVPVVSAADEQDTPVAIAPPAAPLPPGEETPLVLLIEDNADVRAFIRTTLTPAGYRLLEAPDGEAGLALARAEVPDLIVSDVMMPGLDGYQVCAALKADVATSHIPIVLLTARASADDKLAGLETGADAYLAKPFNPRELQVQVRNLLALRQRLQARFALTPALAPESTAAADTPSLPAAPPPTPPDNPLTNPAALAALPALDQQLLRQTADLLQSHLGDEGFGVDQLCVALGLSRTQVHRKFKALTGQTPGECIRLTRLHRALALLRERTATVAEVAYQVGYTSPAHFTASFSRQFGFLPSAAHKQPLPD